MVQDIYSPVEYIKVRIFEPEVPLCETCGTKCGGYLLSTAPCPRKGDRGCLLLKNPRFRLVRGAHD